MLYICTGAENCLVSCRCKVPHEKSGYCFDKYCRDRSISCIHNKHVEGEWIKHTHIRIK